MPYSESEKREIANKLYESQDAVWANLVRHYYRPFGAPMRLSRPLLEQWHQKHKTGARDPDDIQGCTVQVLLSESTFTIKRFVTAKAAQNYINDLAEHNIDCKIVEPGEMFDFG